MAGSGVHRGNQFKRVKSLTTSVHFLENDAYSFLRCRAIQGDDRHAVILEVFENLAFECSKLFANGLVLFATPVLIEAVLPLVPIKDLGNRVHEGSVFVFRRRKVQNCFSSEVGTNDAILRNTNNRFFAISRLVQGFADIYVEPSLYLLLLRRDRFDDLSS